MKTKLTFLFILIALATAFLFHIVLGLDNPYPLSDVLLRLKEATEYLLYDKNYDRQNYEELNQCVKRADEILTIISNLPNPLLK